MQLERRVVYTTGEMEKRDTIYTENTIYDSYIQLLVCSKIYVTTKHNRCTDDCNKD